MYEVSYLLEGNISVFSKVLLRDEDEKVVLLKGIKTFSTFHNYE